MYNIINSVNSNKITVFAIEELQKYLKLSNIKDNSVTFYISNSLEDLSNFPKEIKEKIETDSKDLILDGVLIFSHNHSIVLYGNGKRGALYSVYSFLEEFLGCKFPEPFIEYIPKKENFNFSNIYYKNNPTFKYRGIAIHGICNEHWFKEILNWLGKNKMNGFQLFTDHYNRLKPHCIDEILKKGMYPNIGGHSREYFYPQEKYFESNPEHFALVNNQRVPNTQLCYSNYDSIDEYAKNIIKYLKDNPEIEMIGVWPSDGYGFCECEECKSTKATDLLIKYYNKLTEMVNRELPHIKCEFLSYICYQNAPETLPNNNLVPTYCEYWSRNQFHPITENLEDNEICRKQIKDWIKISNEVTIFAYYGDDCIKRYLYNPIIDVINKDIKYYKEIGLSGHFVLLTNPESWWSNAPHMYAYATKAWNINKNADEIRNDYYSSIYKENANIMINHESLCKELFNLKIGKDYLLEYLLFWFSYKDHFNLNTIDSDTVRINDIIDKIKCTLKKVKTKSKIVETKIEKLIKDADYIRDIYYCVVSMTLYKTNKNPKDLENAKKYLDNILSSEIVRIDDYNGYRSAAGVPVYYFKEHTDIEILPIDPVERKLLEDNIVTYWNTDDVIGNENNPAKLLYNINNNLNNISGDYKLTFNYISGEDGIIINKIEIIEKNNHQENTIFTSDKKRTAAIKTDGNELLFNINCQKNKDYYLKVQLYSTRGLTSKGIISLRRAT